MNNGTWTIGAITAQAEARLQSNLRFLQDCRTKVQKEDWELTSRMVVNWSRGTFDLWRSLVEGWLENGDTQRLKAIIEATESVTFDE